MKFFFPDSQDIVDPSFDFNDETRSPKRVRNRDDHYAHEVFSSPVYEGLLVSKGIVDSFGENTSRYSLAQRHRLLRIGAHEFFRVHNSANKDLAIMGDCGAFTYVREPVPPYTVDEVLEFYEECRFDFGISLDHVILSYQPKWDALANTLKGVPSDINQRQQLTLHLASEFFTKHKTGRLAFKPLGVAQGWSPSSYAYAVQELQKIGYRYIALGGMVPLKTKDILCCLESITSIRLPDTHFHLLGVTRTEYVSTFAKYGVVSFDSTSPLRQAFKDDKDNYYTLNRTYTAIRVPQVDGNARLLRRITAGQVSQECARQLEKNSLELLEQYDKGKCSLEQVLDAVVEYDSFCDPKSNRREIYREVLTDRPWAYCSCDICKRLAYHVIIFRGAERNRRRGFHNIWVFYKRLHRELGLTQESLDIETVST